MPKKFELVQYPNGTYSLKDPQSAEPMHSSIGPWDEAMQLYVEQSRLAERLAENSSDPLIIHDVGMGIAANALAAILSAKPTRPLEVHSFETDLGSLETALELSDRFPFLSIGTLGHEAARAIVTTGEWRQGKTLWHLYKGRFQDHLASAPKPELVFYDFHSPKLYPELWTWEIFKSIRDRATSKTLLCTYSASTRIRAALLLAGFHVGYGRKTSSKADTTVASVSREQLERPLDQSWFGRFERSDKRLPQDWQKTGLDEASAIEQIRLFVLG